MPLTKDKRTYAIQNKEIMKKWDYEKNDLEGIFPDKITEGSHKYANFICPECGNKWKGIIRDAARYNGCNVCMKKARSISNIESKLKKTNGLFETNPELAREWDYVKNEEIGLYPEKVMAGTPKKAYWICPLKHHYMAYISNRALKHSGCPYCSGQSVLKGFNDLASTRKDLLREWDYEKNDKIGLYPENVMKGSHIIANWICPIGHEYKKEIKLRSLGQGCIECAKETQTSFPEQAICYYMKKIFNSDVFNRYGNPEIDIYIPSIKLGIEYDGIFAHKNKEKKEQQKDIIIKNKGIRLIRIKETKDNKNDSENVIYCKPKNDYDYLITVIYKLLKIIKTDYNVLTNIPINIEKDRIKIEEQYIKSLKENSILTKYPDIAKEWDYEKNGKLKPEYIPYGSSKKYWWHCNNGHSYLSQPKRRIIGTGCPYCSLKKFKRGINDIKTLYPDVVNEWDYALNKNTPEESIAVLSHHFYWKCKKGHSYYATLKSKLKGTKCTICSGKELVVGVNDLETLNPNLAEEWDYEKNGLTPNQVTPNSNLKVYWKCRKCNYSWKSIISNRPRCPHCVEMNNKINIYDLNSMKLICTCIGIKEVCKKLNLNYNKQHGNISSVCNKKQKTLLNMYIVRYDREDEFKFKTLEERKQELNISKRNR